MWRPSDILRSIRFKHTGVCLDMHWGRAKLFTVTKHVFAIISISERCVSESLTYMGMTQIINNTTIWLVVIGTTSLEQNSILPKQSCSCQLCRLFDTRIWAPSKFKYTINIKRLTRNWIHSLKIHVYQYHFNFDWILQSLGDIGTLKIQNPSFMLSIQKRILDTFSYQLFGSNYEWVNKPQTRDYPGGA